MTRLVVRSEAAGDAADVRDVHVAAFESPAEADLVDVLRRDGLAVVGTVAEVDGRVVAHALLGRITVGGAPALALAPVAVSPEYQRRGLGTLVVRAAIEEATLLGERLIVVLGDPRYYARFGFGSAADAGVTAPWTGPALQVLALPAYDGGARGEAVYPAPYLAVG
ncbi:MAG TPA: N-acetyltransferase [Acidothermales bacterium]